MPHLGRDALAYVGMSVVGSIAAAVLAIGDPAPFEPFFGPIHPVAAVVIVSAVGGVSLALLRRCGWRVAPEPGTGRRWLWSAVLLATIFGAAVVVADVTLRYPRGINVPPPEAFLFYPVMGLVAQVVFHVLPLSVLLTVLVSAGRQNREWAVWCCMAVTALAEPVFQVAFAPGPAQWVDAFTAVNVFGFGLAQLWLFRRYGFVPMFVLRLVYYGYWHIAWGVARLHVLF